MKKNTILLGVLTFTAFVSCNKKDDEPHTTNGTSYWMVNNDTITHKNIVVNTTPALTELRVIALPPNKVLSFAFQMGSLPHSGTYKVDYVASNPATMCNVYVTYNDTRYDVAPIGNATNVRITTLPNGKGRYELEPTWFYKHLTPSDGILVKGVIIEP